MRAETGVGPSIASGSQTCSGNWADLPIAPAKTSSATSISGIGNATSVGLVEHVQRLADVQGAGVDEDRHDPEREPDVADAVDDERLLRREGRGALAEPEADEQVARQADQLPGHEDQQPRVGEDQHQHAEHEEVQVGEEPPVARVVAHVADRVDVHEQADRRDDDQQAGGQLVDEEAGLDVERAGRDPLEEGRAVAVLAERLGAGQGGERDGHRDEPDGDDGQDGDPVGLLAEPPADERRDGEAAERQDDEQGDERLGAHRRISSYSSTSGVFLLR